MSQRMLEILRNTLLMGLLIMLVYVLYKRLLRVLGKDELKNRPRPIDHRLIIHPARQAELHIKLSQSTELKISVCDERGNECIAPLTQTFPQGQNLVALDLKQLTSGRYYYHLQSPSETVSCYFKIA